MTTDEAGQNSHLLNANFNFQIHLNANLNANAALTALKQISTSSTAPNKLKMHSITLTTFVVNRGPIVLLL